MTTFTFFNANPPHTKITNEVAASWVGQTVPIRVAGKLKGHGVITEAKADNNGVYITYKTDANLGIELELEVNQ